jgi:hypothetical protein
VVPEPAPEAPAAEPELPAAGGAGHGAIRFLTPEERAERVAAAPPPPAPEPEPEPEPVAAAPAPAPAPDTSDRAGHGKIRLRSAAPAVEESAPAAAPSAPAAPARAPTPHADPEIAALETAAHAASKAAYDAYNLPHGQRPAGNAPGLLAEAAQAAQALAAAKTAKGL